MSTTAVRRKRIPVPRADTDLPLNHETRVEFRVDIWSPVVGAWDVHHAYPTKAEAKKIARGIKRAAKGRAIGLRVVTVLTTQTFKSERI